MPPILPDGWSESDSINDRLEAFNIELQDMIFDLGFTSIGDIIVDLSEQDQEDIRAGQYSTLLEAMLDMADTAVWEFTRYYYDPIEDTWGVVVLYES